MSYIYRDGRIVKENPVKSAVLQELNSQLKDENISEKFDSLKEIAEYLSKNLEVSSEKLINITYSELKLLRDNSQLVPGSFYRITDYVTTTTQEKTKSANHPFDVIVLALSENTLCEDAKAILHEGDTYFADSDLSAWELKYCLDNDKTRFEWADETNGKGVIYRMIDEKRNDCPYDFKNILFYNTKFTSSATSDKYYYTFSYVVGGVLYDGTAYEPIKNCYGNVMGEYRSSEVLQLNKNVFRNTSYNYEFISNTLGNNCYYNTFGEICLSNTFGDYCTHNTLGDSCYDNKLGNYCNFNTFGNYCESNTFGDYCESNTLKNRCRNNTFRNTCSSNTLGTESLNNTFGIGCYNNSLSMNCIFTTLGENCSYNMVKNNCKYNKFGNDCKDNTMGGYCEFNILGDQLQYRTLDSNKTSITHNEEYFDDGSGQLVPTKHPDLSTQPSILPYKFMGQYVYEQLVHKNIGDVQFEVQLPVEKPLFLECVIVGSTSMFSVSYITYSTGQLTIVPVKVSLDNTKQVEFARIVYTSMPEESSYYGYNNYGNIEEDFNNAVVIRLEGDYTSAQKVTFFGENTERIDDTTYVYKNLSSAPSATTSSISIEDNMGNNLLPKSAKIYLDGVELDSAKVVIKNYGIIDFVTPLESNDYNTIEAIINL